MNEDQLISLGQYCESLLGEEHFTTLVKRFETQTMEHLLSTTPTEKEKREHLYASFAGVRDFLGLMKFFVQTKDELLEEQNTALSVHEDTDALPTEFDR